MFSTISALEIARQHSKVSHDSNYSKSPDITKLGHFGVPKTTLRSQWAQKALSKLKLTPFLLVLPVKCNFVQMYSTTLNSAISHLYRGQNF
jgi:hypothetical protein